MEGPLELWQGMMGIGGWSRRYFVLNGAVLGCYDRRSGTIETEINLKVSTLKKSKKKNNQFTIMTGRSRYRLKTESEELRGKWMETL